MKNAYPSREKDRWEHALTRPFTRRITFEVIELMRADLFEYLDVLTTSPHEDDKSAAWRDNEIQRTADRLKEMMAHRPRAACAAMKAGRVDYEINISPEDDTPEPSCGPFSGPGWESFHQQWERTQA